MTKTPKIVLTGGGHGGKSAFMQQLSQKWGSEDQWIFIPELADLAYSLGLRASTRDFETMVYSLQISVEQTVSQRTTGRRAILCHRGSLDPLAFWIRKGWAEEEFHETLHTSREAEYARYACVLHLQTTAIGAETVYGKTMGPRPPEPREDAIKLDQLCGFVWSKHPRYIPIHNDQAGWDEKFEATLKSLLAVLESASE